MTNPLLALTIKPTFRAMSGKYTKAEKNLLRNRRAQVVALGRRYVEYAREEAPEKTGAFKKSIRFRTFQTGETLGFTVTSKQPLGTFIVKGTKPHIILPRRAKALRFVIGDRVIFAKMVRHPGTKPNRFHGRAYARWLPGARASLAAISTKFVRDLQ